MPSSSTRYRQALSAISARTGAPLPSLILSFGILHEITAVAPLFGIFYGARTLGVGERIVTAVANVNDDPNSNDSSTTIWAKRKCKTWIEEGEGWAERVGRRYGVFGYEKKNPEEDAENGPSTPRPYSQGYIAGDVANAVVAYGMTKALLPVRIALSLYLSPAFSRGVVEPVRRSVIRQFKSKN
ncbi:hypothetical protein V5O48_003366 [Marasmius crinis-equi]|uniref:DUF1279 domain-containing protein n=1 Tax=Marasmius crinis-equi TaxID=585013 RepID=A0ABR3FTH7_9AGAR